MSSILKALKKVEMESATQAGPTSPWPAPSSPLSSSKSGGRRWWILFGFMAILVLVGVVYWQINRTAPRSSAETVVSAPAADTLEKDSHPDHGTQEKNKLSQVGLPAKPAPDADSSTESKAKQNNGHFAAMAPANIPQTDDLLKTETKSSAVIPKKPESDFAVSGAGVPSQKKKEPVKDTTLGLQKERNAEDEENAADSKIAEEEEEKTFKEDPRINLQAVVWATEPGSRFVVINNKMIREGGTVDNIVVEKINPDDVLLSEGDDRWYVAFTIR